MNAILDKKLLAREAAATVLTVAAGKASSSLDSLACWFLAAIGAGLAVTISQIENVTKYLSVQELSCAAKLFLVATVLCVIQRFIQTIVNSGASSAKELSNMERFNNMDIQEFISQMTRAYPFFMRFLVAGVFKDIASGDLAAAGRMLLRFSIYQALFVGVEITLLVFIVGKIAFGITT